MVKPQNAYAAEQRINAAAEKIMALDGDLRQLSWTRIREIAVELAASEMPVSERLEFARELDSIAATNLALLQRQQVLSAMEEEGEKDSALDEHAAQQARVASASAAVLLQIQADADSAEKPQENGGSVRAAASVAVAAAEGFPHPDLSDIPQLAESDSSAGLVQRVSRKLDSLMDAVGLTPDGADDRHAVPDEVAIADADAGEAPDLEHSEENGAAEQRESPTDDAPAVSEDDGNYDAKGRWRGNTAPVNVVQMLNAEMVYQSEDEDDKDRYAAAAAQASLYDDPVAVILPSADELEAHGSAGHVHFDMPEPEEQAREQAASVDAPQDDGGQAADLRARSDGGDAGSRSVSRRDADESPAASAERHTRTNRDDVDRLQAPEAKPAVAPGTGGTKPADPKPAEGEPSISIGFSSHSRAERAILAERERKEAAKREKKEARKHRFPKIFGRKSQGDDGFVVIPRGEAKDAPDDLFVSDRHRAAAKRQGASKHEGTNKRSHAPGHAKSGGASDGVDDADDAEGHEAEFRATGCGTSEAKGDDAPGGAGRAHSDGGDQLDRRVAPSAFELFHTSRDGKISFFRDAEGRITAVNTARLV